MRLFSHLFLTKPPRLLLETKRFANKEDSLGFSALYDIFQKKNIENFFFKKCLFPLIGPHQALVPFGRLETVF